MRGRRQKRQGPGRHPAISGRWKVAAGAIALALLPAPGGVAGQGLGSFGTSNAVATPEPAPAAPPVPGARLFASAPEAMRDALQAEGYPATLERDELGDPMIVSKTSRSTFWIYFFDCVEGADCRSVQFHSAWELDRPPGLEALNRFNGDYRFIRTWLNDEGMPRLQMDLLMRDEGMGQTVFAGYLELWRVLLTEWETAIGL